MSYNRKTIADLKDGDTVWIHDRYGGMMKGQLKSGDIVGANGVTTTFQRETRTGYRCISHSGPMFTDTPYLRVHWEGDVVGHNILKPFWFVYSERQTCQDVAWSIQQREKIAKLIDTTDVRTLKRVGKLLGLPRPSQHTIHR